MKFAISILTLTLLFGGALFAFSNRSMTPQASAQANNEVTISNHKFEPKTLTVPEGTTVKWNNKGGLHTVKSDSDLFVSKNLKEGETFSYEFTKAGKYPYFCAYHGSKGGNDMAGTIIVVKKK